MTSVRPQIFSSWKYSVMRARTAMGAVRNTQLSTASRLPTKRPPTTVEALTPDAMNSGPIISSVPAVCSPAYWPTKLEKPSRARSGTGSRSYSSTGSACEALCSSAMRGSYRVAVAARAAGAATRRMGPKSPAGTGCTLSMSCGSNRVPYRRFSSL